MCGGHCLDVGELDASRVGERIEPFDCLDARPSVSPDVECRSGRTGYANSADNPHFAGPKSFGTDDELFGDHPVAKDQLGGIFVHRPI